MQWDWLAITGGATVCGLAAGFYAERWLRRWRAERDATPPVRPMLEAHFQSTALDKITVSERRFPFRVRADLQNALDGLLADYVIRHFYGVRKEYASDGLNFAALLAGGHSPAVSVPPEYEAVDVGGDEPVRCLRAGLWLVERDGTRYAVLLGPAGRPYGEPTGVQFQVAAPNDPAGTRLADDFFRRLEDAVQRADSYRGKVLSLEQSEHSYSGESAGITVHRLGPVPRDHVILPAATLDLLDRNVVRFAEQRPRLRAAGQPTRKGLLFYGPPGTGKTLTIRYLAHALPGHTTLLVSAEQVGLLGEYMTLARLLQPSIVVLEDVDLIARDRAAMNSPCEEVLLNKLLNEMDGLKEEADILFVLTTNRPEALEAALASRPGRVDQAIEFPPPDAEGRRKLVRLYARDAAVGVDVEDAVVQRTDGVSAAFIKELMRRATQYGLERDGAAGVNGSDVDQALDEMLFRGGSLNLKLLGAAGVNGRPTCEAGAST